MIHDWLLELKRQYRLETEPERYEQAQGEVHVFHLGRRELLSGLLLIVTMRRTSGETAEVARFHFAGDGVVTLFTGKNEMGQGLRTLLAQATAEELRIPFERVRVVLGDTALTPDDGGTWASLTTPQTVPAVRQAAAAAREALKKSDSRLTPPSAWKVLGQSIPPAFGREIVTGALKYASDLKLPGGGVAGKVNRGPRKPCPSYEALFAQFKEKSAPPVPQPGARYPPVWEQGDWKAALAAAERRHEAEYTLAYIAHVPLEPRAAIAEWADGRLTVHSGTQAPFLVRKQLADEFKIPEKDVHVVAHPIGGAFGGKQNGECEIEAARLARQAGKPVKLAWTREEEFTCAYARPAGVLTVATGADAQGRITAWEFRNYNSGASGLKPPYDIAAYFCGFHRSESPVKQGSYRSLACAGNTFARETHVDELAALFKTDPVDYRLKNIADQRLREAIERGAERFGWSRRAKSSGMACNLEKDARFALFTEIDTGGKTVRVVRMVMAFDPGAILNPDNLRNQITGGLIQGIGGALFERLEIGPGGIRNGRLSQYRVPRFKDVPEIEVILIDRKDVAPAGAGEAPITVPAPAIGNAFFAATGRRLRGLPLFG